MRNQQFQCVPNAGGTCVTESRGFHRVTSPAAFPAYFPRIRRRRPAKVKFVYRPIISVHSTFGLVIIGWTKHGRPSAERPPGRGNAMKVGFFTMPIHPLGKD